MKYQHTIFICTHGKDFPWLKFCLRSILKYATGFENVTIVVPIADHDPLTQLTGEVWTPRQDQRGKAIICVKSNNEWPGKGMLWHENAIMHADQWCPDAEFIFHIDPDCIFTAPVTPQTFIHNSKPILRYEPFAQIGLRHPGVLKWQEATANCLPFPILYETMRCHPEVYHRDLYQRTRQHISLKTGMMTADYIQSCRNEFPQTFCEFVTLGNVAIHDFPDLYEPIMQTGDLVTPPNHLQQFWSHGAMDAEQNIWVNGSPKFVVPIKMMEKYGLT